MVVKIDDNKVLTSGSFLKRQKPITRKVSYNIGYAYSSVQAGVSLQFTNEDDEQMSMRLTPEQAEKMASELLKWAEVTRKYQETV